jgi:hypothetical protein
MFCDWFRTFMENGGKKRNMASFVEKSSMTEGKNNICRKVGY